MQSKKQNKMRKNSKNENKRVKIHEKDFKMRKKEAVYMCEQRWWVTLLREVGMTCSVDLCMSQYLDHVR